MRPAPLNHGARRTASGSGGVWPPCWNHAMPSTTVRPAAVIVIAMPITTWSPRWLTQRIAVQHRQRDADAAPRRQRQRQRAGHRGGGARGERGEQHLALEAEVDHAGALAQAAGQRAQDQRRRHAQRRGEQRADGDVIHGARTHRRFATRGAAAQREPRTRQRRRRHLRHRAREQHDQPLQREHHVAAEAGDLERQLGAALVQRAEQQRRQHDAHRVVAPDQRHRDAGEARADHVVEQQAAVHAGDLVDAHQPGQRARQRHRDHDLRARPDAGVARRLGREADRAQRVARPRAPHQQVDEHGAGQPPAARSG